MNQIVRCKYCRQGLGVFASVGPEYLKGVVVHHRVTCRAFRIFKARKALKKSLKKARVG